MLFGSFVIGTLLYGLAIIPAFRKDLYSTILIYTFSYIGIILITSLRHLSYRFRAICWLGVAYILGTLNLAESGFNVDAGLFFIAFIALAILLLDLSGGLGRFTTFLYHHFDIWI